MVGNKQLTEKILRGQLILPSDATLVPVDNLDPSLRKQVGGEPGDVALTRSYTRQPSKIIDPDLAALIARFREPKTIAEAVARHAKENNDDPEELLENTLSIFPELVYDRILIPESEQSEDRTRPLQTGDYFGPYEIIECLQVFSDTEIYKARYDSEFVALKIANSNEVPEGIEGLTRESRILRLLEGEVAPRLVEEGRVDGRYYIAQEWVEGSSIAYVASELRQEQDYAALLELMQELVKAYATLLSRSILHGDIHPRNAVVSKKKKVRLIDFGLARHLEDVEELPERGGVAFFYEPEAASAALKDQALPPSTPKGEQFSVAALLFHLATGYYYDDFDLEQEAMLSAISDPSPKPFSDQGGKPWPSLEACLGKALARDPDFRYPSYEAFLSALKSCDLPEPVSAGFKTGQQEDRKASMLVDKILGNLVPDSSIWEESLEHGSFCSVSRGAAGIAYTLYRFAANRDDPALLDLAEVWLDWARCYRKHPQAFTDLENAQHEHLIGPISIHHREVGLLWVEGIVALTSGDLNDAIRALEQFTQHLQIPCEQLDVTLGRCSAILACATLVDKCELSFLEQVRDTLIEEGTRLLNSIWEEVTRYDPIGESDSWQNLGMAHGWAGLLYTTLRWHQATGYTFPKGFHQRLEEFLECPHPVGRGLNVKWYIGGNEVIPGMPGWCNGGAGLVHLGSMAYKVLREERWFTFAERAAWHTWEAGTGPIDLCCGMAGRAYALFEFYKISEESQWLNRASRLAKSLIGNSGEVQNVIGERHSLFKGELGLALALDELERSESAVMPLMGREP